MDTTVLQTETINHWTYDLLLEWGIPETIASYIHLLVLLALLAVVVYIVNLLVEKILVRLFKKLAERTKTMFDDFLVRNKMIVYLARLIPVIIIIQAIPPVFFHFPKLVGPAGSIMQVYLVLLLVWMSRSFFRSGRDFLRTKDAFKDKPLDSYLQVVTIVMFIVAGLSIFTILTGLSVGVFLTAMGAASAIVVLVFKDTIMGLVASVQVTTNDMIRIGDWIEMPKYGADGDVIEINLNTLKVQNWDKTFTTIPTYFLITDSFKNWRGMQTSGGRRIKRAIHVKISSIRYLNREEIEELSKIQLLAPYIAERQKDIEQHNTETQADLSMPVNGRNLTNVGLFREYIYRYAKGHPRINQNMTLMVRQLAPNEKGLPIELYMFAADIRWAVYEGIMSDIFDHLLAAVKYFKLEVFELPAADDLRKLTILPQESTLPAGTDVKPAGTATPQGSRQGAEDQEPLPGRTS